jgi:catechol 2,3-dioxygenase-like lactoylglutathione lyase family enzyme
MIPSVKLHHVSFSSKSLSASKAFFGGVLGLAEIDRPAFRFPGAWYALGDRQLHIIENASEADAQAASRLSRSDHMALEVEDLATVRGALEQHHVPYQVGENRDLGIEQIFCHDPDGHVIEFVRYR